jgi:Fe-S-cluster containining protein
MEQGSPPGYALSYKPSKRKGKKLTAEEMEALPTWVRDCENSLEEDRQRWRDMPPQLRDELKAYYDGLLAGTGEDRGGRPCLWLDMETRRCRHYEWRPSICRDFQVGEDSCHDWRKCYGINPPP